MTIFTTDLVRLSKANMTNLTNPQLLYFLACPTCGSELFEAEDSLTCTYCGKEYKVKTGIPLLYPDNMDLEHLRREEDLAKMMKRPRLSRKDRFSSDQWKDSKREFWGMVRDNIAAPPGSFINVGCGYDTHFGDFEQAGYTFVNFDIVYHTLYDLQRNFGARSCAAGDINSLPFKKNSFDYVVCIDVIHHENDKLPVLLESFRNLLKPGGILFLEDLNAWGMFQFAKSVLLPRPLYRFLRSTYHRLGRSAHRPADYEFPTSVWRVKGMFEELGFCGIRVYPNEAYPGIDPVSFQVYKLFSRIEWVRKYHNYHYMLSGKSQHTLDLG